MPDTPMNPARHQINAYAGFVPFPSSVDDSPVGALLNDESSQACASYVAVDARPPAELPGPSSAGSPSGSVLANPTAEERHGANCGPEPSPQRNSASLSSLPEGPAARHETAAAGPDGTAGFVAARQPSNPTPPGAESNDGEEVTLAREETGRHGEITVTLSIREARALWRLASMFDVVLAESFGPRKPCEIDMALAKVELGLLMAGENAE